MRLLIGLLALSCFGQNFQQGGSKVSWLHNHSAVIGNGIVGAWDLSGQSNVAVNYPDISSPTASLNAGNPLNTNTAITASLSGITFGATSVLRGPTLAYTTGASLSLFSFIKPSQTAAYAPLLGKVSSGSSGYLLSQDNAGHIYVAADAGFWTGTSSVSTSVFSDWLGIINWTGSTYTFNVLMNGASQTLGSSGAVSTLTSTGTFGLGKPTTFTPTRLPFLGVMKFSAMWNRSVTLTEAAEIHRVITTHPQIDQPAIWSLVDFNGTGGTMNAYYGYDGLTWFPASSGTQFTPPGGSIRDPAQAFFNGTSSIAYTDSGFTVPASTFSLASSSTATAWSSVGQVSVTISGTTQAWMGRWYVPCGPLSSMYSNCEAGSSTYYIPLTVSTTPATAVPHSIYWASTTNPLSASGWSFAASPINGPSTLVDYIDAQVLCISVCSSGNGDYRALIKNDTAGVKDIELWGCTSNCLGNGLWTQLASGNWAGWAGSGTPDNIEAPNSFQMPDRWRIYFYLPFPGPQISYYSDCFASSAVCFSLTGGASWTVRQLVSPGGVPFQNGSIVRGVIGQ